MLERNFDKKIIKAEVKLYDLPKNSNNATHISDFSYGNLMLSQAELGETYPETHNLSFSSETNSK